MEIVVERNGFSRTNSVSVTAKTEESSLGLRSLATPVEKCRTYFSVAAPDITPYKSMVILSSGPSSPILQILRPLIVAGSDLVKLKLFG